MFLNKLSSSLHPAALALSVFAALPTLAQTASAQVDIEPTAKAQETRGFASGSWVPPSLSAPGWMHGLMVDARGQVRFEIDAITHVVVPSEIPDYDIGSMYGRLLSARMQDGAIAVPSKDDVSKPVVEPASIYVIGAWSVHHQDGMGRFTAVAYLEIAPLPMPLILLDIGGVFRMPFINPLHALPHVEDPIAVPLLPGALEPKFVVCYAGPDLYTTAARLAAQAQCGVALDDLAGGLNIIESPTPAPQAVRFHARWLTRN